MGRSAKLAAVPARSRGPRRGDRGRRRRAEAAPGQEGEEPSPPDDGTGLLPLAVSSWSRQQESRCPARGGGRSCRMILWRATRSPFPRPRFRNRSPTGQCSSELAAAQDPARREHAARRPPAAAEEAPAAVPSEATASERRRRNVASQTFGLVATRSRHIRRRIGLETFSRAGEAHEAWPARLAARDCEIEETVRASPLRQR